MEPDSTKTAVDTGAFGVEYAYQSVFRNPYRCGMCRKTRRHGRQDADECFHGNNGGSVLFYRTAVVLFSGISVRVASGIYRPEYGIGICMEFKKRGNGCLQCRPAGVIDSGWRYCIVCAEYQKQFL